VRLVGAFPVTMPFCLAGARALEVAVSWHYYRARPREILRLTKGGAGMYGAIPPALLISVPLAGWLGIPFGTFWDVAAVSILAGMIPTRLGCLGAGCCAGRPTRSHLGLELRNLRGVRDRRYPTQIFESLFGAALLAASLAAWGWFPFPGALALSIAAGYGAGRFALEALRERSSPYFAGLSAYQWMSAGLVAIGGVGLAIGWGGSHAARTVELAFANDQPGTLHLLASALLLIPVVRLFRFLGCDLIFELKDPPILHQLQMIVVVPDLGTGAASVTIQFLREPEMTELDESPIELAPAGTAPDGRLNFEALRDLPEAAYTVTCTVSRTGAITRVGSCSGELNAPGLVLAFNAENGSAPNSLQARLCFESP
jgi:phosphatidylglycerol:prolipoprotein diacylglycerol transferase